MATTDTTSNDQDKKEKTFVHYVTTLFNPKATKYVEDNAVPRVQPVLHVEPVVLNLSPSATLPPLLRSIATSIRPDQPPSGD